MERETLIMLIAAGMTLVVVGAAVVVIFGSDGSDNDPFSVNLGQSINGGAAVQRSNDSFRITAIPDLGYKFEKWVDQNGNTVSTEPEYMLRPDSDIVITPIFVRHPDYALITLSDQGHGKTGCVGMKEGSGFYKIGSTIKFTPVAEDGYDFRELRDSERTYDTDFTVTGDVTLTAVYGKITTLTIHTNLANQGSETNITPVWSGDQITFGEQSKDGYDFRGWLIDEEYTDSITFTVPDEGSVLYNMYVLPGTGGTVTVHTEDTGEDYVLDGTFYPGDPISVHADPQLMGDDRIALWDGTFVGEDYETTMGNGDRIITCSYHDIEVELTIYTIKLGSTTKIQNIPVMTFGSTVDLDSFVSLNPGEKVIDYLDSDKTTRLEGLNSYTILKDNPVVYLSIAVNIDDTVTIDVDTSSSEYVTVTVTIGSMNGIRMLTVSYTENDITTSIQEMSLNHVVLTFDRSIDTTIQVNVDYKESPLDKVETREIHIRHLTWKYQTVNGDLGSLLGDNNHTASVFIDIPADLLQAAIGADLKRQEAWSSYPDYTATNAVIQDLKSKLDVIMEGYDEVDRLNCLIKMVQSIPYKYDDNSKEKSKPYGVSGYDYWDMPVELLWDEEGDCEDHAFLFGALAREMGHDVALSFVLTPSGPDNEKRGGHLAALIRSAQLDAYFANETPEYDSNNGLYYYTVGDLSERYYFYDDHGEIFYYAESTPSIADNAGHRDKNGQNVGYMPNGYQLYLSRYTAIHSEATA